MEDSTRNIDVEKLLSFSDDLLHLMKDKKDASYSKLCMSDSQSLLSSCNSDFNEVQRLLEEYQKKIDGCTQETVEAESEVTSDAELALLEKELEEQTQKERLLQEELRNIVDDINELERKVVSIEEKKLAMKKLKLDELQVQRKLSMYASVTNIIPNLDNDSIISGYIVERDRKVVQNFKFHQPKKDDTFDTCNKIWRMMDM